LPDPQYVERVEGRVQRIERAEITTRQDIGRTNEELERARGDILAEMALLREDLLRLEQETAGAVERVKATVAQFKTVVKKGDIARLQARIDLWSPQDRITRGQFVRMLAQR
jgi:hypothetical protein